ncbi:hypothetical protein C8R44DRAFT_979890 [Mycena epipterygia]|nr:hypothetical protein C8R44DRAFT_979890 [Mycena epipterygia]
MDLALYPHHAEIAVLLCTLTPAATYCCMRLTLLPWMYYPPASITLPSRRRAVPHHNSAPHCTPSPRPCAALPLRSIPPSPLRSHCAPHCAPPRRRCPPSSSVVAPHCVTLLAPAPLRSLVTSLPPTASPCRHRRHRAPWWRSPLCSVVLPTGAPQCAPRHCAPRRRSPMRSPAVALPGGAPHCASLCSPPALPAVLPAIALHVAAPQCATPPSRFPFPLPRCCAPPAAAIALHVAAPQCATSPSRFPSPLPRCCAPPAAAIALHVAAAQCAPSLLRSPRRRPCAPRRHSPLALPRRCASLRRSPLRSLPALHTVLPPPPSLCFLPPIPTAHPPTVALPPPPPFYFTPAPATYSPPAPLPSHYTPYTRLLPHLRSSTPLPPGFPGRIFTQT